ncbi:dimethylhistidine N-methyltransferase [Pedobacter psychrotolerans]|uniref:Dimethylhistidine N-methyltransferase n=1 Tax=Pedobacter psychrotolerans TaxID=1843235 RepID=A0A4R2H1W1_9SPHI|nr:L-histidine N(alpha)-methyltransferase [Pedobacter psychrotolerans]TCO18679.1 dimethylhistidine N-methyltransferase [Pedobacter psychrotolerans]GGE69994.1 dimethylhistidine N-methyltransferase [Pedobacter psychrotolerans]
MSTIISKQNIPVGSTFLNDVLAGLTAERKSLSSKYFYDEIGDHIFQQIMEMEDYYLTNAEMEILQHQTEQIADVIAADPSAFDLIELGAGDATKSVHLLQSLINRQLEFTYLPIDISRHVIEDLEENLPKKLPTLKVEGLNGDYFAMVKKAKTLSSRRKVLLFMGANIGNMNVAEAEEFCKALRNELSAEDLLIIGFDLKKNPRQILAAYDDAAGITKSFNLNLLSRINRELGGDFDISKFDHYASYDPESGACKSYLISLSDQLVNIGDETIRFHANEHIYMEISQKYSLPEVSEIAASSGFIPVAHFFDQHQYFVDAIWKVN